MASFLENNIMILKTQLAICKGKLHSVLQRSRKVTQFYNWGGIAISCNMTNICTDLAVTQSICIRDCNNSSKDQKQTKPDLFSWASYSNISYSTFTRIQTIDASGEIINKIVRRSTAHMRVSILFGKQIIKCTCTRGKSAATGQLEKNQHE